MRHVCGYRQAKLVFCINRDNHVNWALFNPMQHEITWKRHILWVSDDNLAKLNNFPDLPGAQPALEHSLNRMSTEDYLSHN